MLTDTRDKATKGRVAPPQFRWPVALAIMSAAIAFAGCSGGGFSDALGGDLCANNACAVVIPPDAVVLPQRSVVQVGTAVTLSSSTTVTTPTYQWQRSADGVNFVDIAGATGASYSLTAQLPDDATTFRLRVGQAGTFVVAANALLFVSSQAPVTYADTEFADSDWSAAVVASPVAGAADGASQAASGGNPGAWRHTSVTLPTGTSSVTVYDSSAPSVYEPAAHGAIRAIDYTEDCMIGASAPSIFSTTMQFTQAGRVYAAKTPATCNSPTWRQVAYTALLITDFVQVSGPACTANEICPDFSANGGSIGFGYVLSTSLNGSSSGGSFDRGIDNWKTTVWRR